MKKIVHLLLLAFLGINSQNGMAQYVYKENFPGGIFIYDGDEPYENLKDIPNRPSGQYADLIINSLENGLFDQWEPLEALSLTYCVSDTFGEQKERVVEALKTASSDWMVAANIKYIYLSQHDSNCDQNNENVIFDVRPISNQPYLARSFFPHTTRANRNILVDASSFQFNQIALNGFLRHELGHTLGFRHEHISPYSQGLCPESDNYSSITSYDPMSVMHYPQCGGKNIITNLLLTSLDQAGAKVIYPFP